MKRIIISVLILTILGAMASAAPNITLTLNTTLDNGGATVTSITDAILLDRAGGIIGTAVLPDNMTAQFDLDGIIPGDYFIEINGLAGDRVPTRIDSNESDINQSVGMGLINSVIGNDTTPTIYRIKARSGGRHPVVNYNTGENETKYPFVIVPAFTNKIEVRAVNTSEELSNFSTTGNAHPFQTWVLGSNNHGIAYSGTDTCSVCHGSLDLKLPNYSDIVPPFPVPSGGWCFKCHNGPEGDASGFVDPAVVAANGTIAGTVTNESGSAIEGATVAADSQSNITDLNGNYTISIASGTYTLTASAAGYLSNSTSVTVTSGATFTQNFALTQQLLPEGTFNISGFKIDNDTGMGLANWNITLTEPDNTVMTNVTDSSGMYQFMNLSNGTYTIAEEMQPGWTNVSEMPMEVTIAGSDMMNQNITNTMISQQPNVTSFELTPSKSAVLNGSTITIKALNVNNVTDTNFNGMANITVNASKNANAVTYQPNVTFSNGIAILTVTSNISQFVTVTATSGSITGSTDIAFADMVFDLDLGWNLISIPNFADPSSVDLILKNVKNNGVVGYDPGNKTFSTPADLQPLYGYWINVTAPNQSIEFIADTNIRSVPPGRDLFEGWNLIGVVASKQEQNKELNAGLLFQPLKTGGKPLYSYLVSYKNPSKTYTVGDDLTDRTPLNKGQGYWLFLNTLTETNKDSLVWAGKPWLPN